MLLLLQIAEFVLREDRFHLRYIINQPDQVLMQKDPRHGLGQPVVLQDFHRILLLF